MGTARQALGSDKAFRGFDNVQQFCPHHEGLAETPYPPQGLFEALLINSPLALRWRGIQPSEGLARPSYEALDVHIPSFGPLVWRSKKRQSRLLHLGFCLRGGVGKLLPLGIGLQFMLQHGGRFMFDVIDVASLCMGLTKLRNPCLQIRTLIANDFSGHPRLFAALFELLIDDRPVCLPTGKQRNGFDVLMTQTRPWSREGAQTQA